jgi:hypothetical protein
MFGSIFRPFSIETGESRKLLCTCVRACTQDDLVEIHPTNLYWIETGVLMCWLLVLSSGGFRKTATQGDVEWGANLSNLCFRVVESSPENRRSLQYFIVKKHYNGKLVNP